MHPQNRTFEAIVHDVRYKYDIRGDVVPVLYLIQKNTNLPYVCDVGVDFNTKITISPGDTVQITPNTVSPIISNNQLFIVNKVESQRQFPMYVTQCPYCGNMLIRTDPNDLYGRCISRTCIAQFHNNLQNFLQAIGMYFINKDSVIFNHILTRGILRDYIDIFNLTYENIDHLDNVLISKTDIVNFLEFIKRFKGNINLFQILMGLNIPHMTQEEIVDITSKFQYNDFVSIITNNQYEYFSQLTSQKLNMFFSYPSNKDSLLKLSGVVGCGVKIMYQ